MREQEVEEVAPRNAGDFPIREIAVTEALASQTRPAWCSATFAGGRAGDTLPAGGKEIMSRSVLYMIGLAVVIMLAIYGLMVLF